MNFSAKKCKALYIENRNKSVDSETDLGVTIFSSCVLRSFCDFHPHAAVVAVNGSFSQMFGIWLSCVLGSHSRALLDSVPVVYINS